MALGTEICGRSDGYIRIPHLNMVTKKKNLMLFAWHSLSSDASVTNDTQPNLYNFWLRKNVIDHTTPSSDRNSYFQFPRIITAVVVVHIPSSIESQNECHLDMERALCWLGKVTQCGLKRLFHTNGITHPNGGISCPRIVKTAPYPHPWASQCHYFIIK